MKLDRDIPVGEAVPFKDGYDRVRVLVSGRDTGGVYSLMEYAIAGSDKAEPDEAPSYGPRRLHDIEVTLLVRAGRLQFLLDEQILELGPGDYLCVPPGMRHGHANISEEPAELLVAFHPGGIEELFVRHRSDQEPPPAPLGFVEDAVRLFNSSFEDHPDVR